MHMFVFKKTTENADNLCQLLSNVKEGIISPLQAHLLMNIKLHYLHNSF